MLERMGDVAGKRSLWGLAFNTDDVREAPALWLIEQLVANGAEVMACDPEARENTFCGYSMGQDPYEILNGADALLISTEWK